MISRIKMIILPSRNIIIIQVCGQVLISDASNKTLFQMIGNYFLPDCEVSCSFSNL